MVHAREHHRSRTPGTIDPRAFVPFFEDWETFTGTAGDSITDSWPWWTTAGVNGGVEDARTGGYTGTYCIALRPSEAAPVNSYGRIYTTNTYVVGSTVTFYVKKNEAGSNSWAKFKLLDGHNTDHATWNITLSDSWALVTIDVSAHTGENLKLAFEAGTNLAGFGYSTLFDTLLLT